MVTEKLICIIKSDWYNSIWNYHFTCTSLLIINSMFFFLVSNKLKNHLTNFYNNFNLVKRKVPKKSLNCYFKFKNEKTVGKLWFSNWKFVRWICLCDLQIDFWKKNGIDAIFIYLFICYEIYVCTYSEQAVWILRKVYGAYFFS